MPRAPAARRQEDAVPWRRIVLESANHADIIYSDPDAYLETAERCVEAMYTRTPARLINTGGLKKGDRITHRIEVTSLADIDEDLMRWLERAHDMDR